MVPALIPTAFLLGSLVNTGFTQQATPRPTIIEVACMKVDPAKVEDYVSMERNTWKPMHQERVRQGRLRSWTLYEVRFPAGTERECDYRTVNTYNALADIDRPIDDIVAKVHPSVPFAELARRTYAGRNLTRSELWYQVDQTQ